MPDIKAIDPALHRQAKAQAASEGKTIKAWIEGLIAKALTRKGKP